MKPVIRANVPNTALLMTDTAGSKGGDGGAQYGALGTAGVFSREATGGRRREAGTRVEATAVRDTAAVDEAAAMAMEAVTPGPVAAATTVGRAVL